MFPSSGSDSDSDSSSSSASSSSSFCASVVSDEDAERESKKANGSGSAGEKEELSKQEPVEDLNIVLPESVELLPFGKVASIIEHLVIIESLKGLPPVNEDTVFFKEDRHSIGKVFEVFGPVSHPFYVVQFNGPEHIETKDVKIHDSVCFAPSIESFTQYIFPEKIKQERGSDASWMNDDEPPPEALDFSDDEKERAAKQLKKSQNVRRKKLRSQQDASNENGAHYQSRRQYPSNYSSGSHNIEHKPSFSRSPFPHSSLPQYLGQQEEPPQQYSSDYTEFQKPSACYQQQIPDSPSRQQYSFPPPSFGTVSNEANHFPPPPPPATWGGPVGCTQNVYDPLLLLLSLPPPPPPPFPPPSSALPDSGNPP